MGYQGEEVILGRNCSAEEWQAAFETAFEDGEWLVQEFLTALSFLGMGPDGEIAPHLLIWGFFSFGEKFSGGFIRAQKQASGSGVVNSASGAIESIMLFV